MKRPTTRAGLAAAIAAGLALSTLAVGSGPAAIAADDAATTMAPFLAPYYTEGRPHRRRPAHPRRPRPLPAALGTTSDDVGWSAVAAADYDGDDDHHAHRRRRPGAADALRRRPVRR